MINRLLFLCNVPFWRDESVRCFGCLGMEYHNGKREGKIMLEFVKSANGIMWSYVLLVILCGTGVYFTVRLKFIQVRKFGEGCRLVFGHFKLNGEKREHGEMTPLQSLATAIAAQVGTGNLTGAATALISGGPGAIFWMWVSAFFGMATIYGEAALAQEYKTTENGEVTGGPVYYIRKSTKFLFFKNCRPSQKATIDHNANIN